MHGPCTVRFTVLMLIFAHTLGRGRVLLGPTSSHSSRADRLEKQPPLRSAVLGLSGESSVASLPTSSFFVCRLLLLVLDEVRRSVQHRFLSSSPVS